LDGGDDGIAALAEAAFGVGREDRVPVEVEIRPGSAPPALDCRRSPGFFWTGDEALSLNTFYQFCQQKRLFDVDQFPCKLLTLWV
jgi:hypothetical protein